MEGMVGNIVQVTYYTLHSYTERKTARENCFLIRMLRKKKTCLRQAKKKQPQIMTNSISNAAAALLTP